MTYVTSLELSKRLAAVSGWGDTDNRWERYKLSSGEWSEWQYRDIRPEHSATAAYEDLSAFDSGFLLRKLPTKREICWYGNMEWRASLAETMSQYADTPENALAELCLALFEAGVLKR